MKNLILCLILGFCSLARAEGLGFALIFNDGAVLQCEMPVNVWGDAKPGETVTVSFADQKKTAIANKQGKWMLQLDPMPASVDARQLSLHAPGAGRRVTLPKVFVGEVWLATGQSNMVQPTRVTKEGREALKKVHPKIHFSMVPKRTGAPHVPPCTPAELAWVEFGPKHNQLAAVAFHFAEELQPKVGKHLGVIQCSYGGTAIESWMPQELLLHSASGERIKWALEVERKQGYGVKEWEKEVTDYNAAKATKEPKLKPPRQGNPYWVKTPGVLHASMTNEIIPYTARGALWYQGEANSSRPDAYVEARWRDSREKVNRQSALIVANLYGSAGSVEFFPPSSGRDWRSLM